MAEMRMGPRLTLGEQMSRNPAFKGRLLAMEFRTPGGNLMRAVAVIEERFPTIQALAVKIDILRGPTFIPEMVVVPAGSFKMGNSKFEPIREVRISNFALGKYPVTNSEFKMFLEATGQKIPELVANTKLSRHPMVNVTWAGATEYCKWLRTIKGKNNRLPTEAEWEYAARGTEGRKYPWGNEWDASKATFNVNGTRPVDAHPEGASPLGVMDLSGNVWEWTADWYAYRYDPKDLKDPKGPETGSSRVLRGGSWDGNDSGNLRSAYRFNLPPERRNDRIGFRVAEDI